MDMESPNMKTPLQADRVVPTTCPYCGVGCQIDLHVANDIIYRIDGRWDNDVNRGNLCVKGRFGCDFVHAPDRLRAPLLKNAGIAPRAARDFHQASWDEALTLTATTLRHLRDTHGPDSIAFLTSAKCTNEENYLMQKLARGIIGTNNVDHCARL